MEIERKFLVAAPPAGVEGFPSTEIRQGYVALEADGTEVRVRSRDGHAALTVKRGYGLARAEEELEIDIAAFDRLWPLTAGRRIEKTRYAIPLDSGRTLELDVYGGELAGLVTAEVEFPTEAAARTFEAPSWLGLDVTDDARYKNRSLATEGVPAPAEANPAVAASAGSAAVAASVATAGSAAVAASAGTAGSLVVAISVATAGSAAVAASAVTFGSAGVFASLITAFGAAIDRCVATVGCARCTRCVACLGCVDCVDCVGCVNCVGLRGAIGQTGRRKRRLPSI